MKLEGAITASWIAPIGNDSLHSFPARGQTILELINVSHPINLSLQRAYGQLLHLRVDLHLPIHSIVP